MFKNFFNLTLTYRLDSDILWSYGRIIDKAKNEIYAPSYDPQWKEVDENYYGSKKQSFSHLRRIIKFLNLF
jgi:hypothetical protein